MVEIYKASVRLTSDYNIQGQLVHNSYTTTGNNLPRVIRRQNRHDRPGLFTGSHKAMNNMTCMTDILYPAKDICYSN